MTQAIYTIMYYSLAGECSVLTICKHFSKTFKQLNEGGHNIIYVSMCVEHCATCL